MLRSQRIFVTGGAGFIGSQVIGRLLDKNQILAYDNLERDSLQYHAFRHHVNLTLVKGDILDIKHLSRVIGEFQPSHVVHCAAIAGIDTVIKSPVKTMRVNTVGTANVLECISCLPELQRVVIFSTSEVFGTHAYHSEERAVAVIGPVGEARWTYAVSKLCGEHLALAYHKERQLPSVVLRPFNVYGPGQVGEGAISTFVQKALKGDEIQIHGDGTQIRAWCYVGDMVRAITSVLEHPAAVGETFNIGNQRAVITIFGLANTIIRVLKSSSTIRFVRKDYADVELRVPDVRRARELLGFEAEVELEQGISLTADYYKNKPEWPSSL